MDPVDVTDLIDPDTPVVTSSSSSSSSSPSLNFMFPRSPQDAAGKTGAEKEGEEEEEEEKKIRKMLYYPPDDLVVEPTPATPIEKILQGNR